MVTAATRDAEVEKFLTTANVLASQPPPSVAQTWDAVEERSSTGQPASASAQTESSVQHQKSWILLPVDAREEYPKSLVRVTSFTTPGHVAASVKRRTAKGIRNRTAKPATVSVPPLPDARRGTSSTRTAVAVCARERAAQAVRCLTRDRVGVSARKSHVPETRTLTLAHVNVSVPTGHNVADFKTSTLGHVSVNVNRGSVHATKFWIHRHANVLANQV